MFIAVATANIPIVNMLAMVKARNPIRVVENMIVEELVRRVRYRGIWRENWSPKDSSTQPMPFIH